MILVRSIAPFVAVFLLIATAPGAANENAIPVSIIDLIAHPEQFHQKLNTVYFGLVIVLALSCVSGLVTQQVFLSRLRRLHHDTWEHLGRPVIFLNSGILNTFEFLRFMWRRKYESLPDAGTVRFGRFLRGFLLFYFVLFLLTGVVFFLTTRAMR